ncbi:hypothetical protein [Leptolyngbya ohadii]|uniref:hypothetical protein n=1 Tax=Leptolyngbya ohadii TaxID=1962290 RepID=UPI000B59F896|nr:hypothetical protein [Leptolyngbya ohadii]
MDSLLDLLDSQTVVAIGAIVVSLLLLRLLLQVVQVGFGSIVSILIVGLVLYFVFGVSPRQLWYEISHLSQDLVRWAQSLT